MDNIKKIKEIKEGLKSLLDKLEILENDKKEFVLTYPRDDHLVFCVDSDTGEIIEVDYTANNIIDRFLFEHGYYFKTKEEVEKHLKERKLLFKLHQWAKEKNGDWEPDWKDVFQEKYYIFYDYYRKKLYFSFNNSTGTINKLPYFKTREIAQECIDEFGEEIKEVWR